MAILPPETNRARHIGGGERAAFTTLFFWSCSLESPRMNARFNPKLGLLVCTLLVSACVSNPSPKVLSEVRTQANPIDRSARAVTNFTPALRCMDEMLFNHGVRDITLMMEAVSYTHLDVYKRQVAAHVALAAGGGQFALVGRRGVHKNPRGGGAVAVDASVPG